LLTRRVLVACLFMGTLLAPASAADAHHFAKRTLKKGAVGKDVRVLQDFLTRSGHRASVDGHFGRATWRALRRFERTNQIKIDGKATISDQRVLQQAVTSREAAAGTTQAQPQPPVEKAVLAADGITAVAPPSAPPEVKAVIEAGNEIATKPYKYGGGHARFPEDSGYDCSGSMSYALHGGKFLKTPMDSTGFMSWGKAGKGRWITTYAHGGHSYMVVAGLRFDTSGLKQDGSRWHKSSRSSSGFTVRHPSGF
jgi:cell wall-associated NlpC family hydrolase